MAAFMTLVLAANSVIVFHEVQALRMTAPLLAALMKGGAVACLALLAYVAVVPLKTAKPSSRAPTPAPDAPGSLGGVLFPDA